MKTREEFGRYFEDTIAPQLKPLEARRKAALKKIVLLVVAMTAGMMVALVMLGQRQAPGHVVFGVFVVCVAAIAAVTMMMRFDIAGEYKRSAVARLVSFADGRLFYDPKGSIGREVFAASGMFPGRIGLYRGSDLVTGKAGDAAFSFCNLLVRRERTNPGRRRRAPVFQGIFLTMDARRSVRGTTVLLPKRPMLHVASLLERMRSLFGSGVEEVELEDPEFTSHFTVRSTDPGEARSILTPDMRQRIMSLRQDSERGLYLSFAGQKTCAAVSFGGELFGANLTRTVLARPLVERDFEALQIAKGIAEDLEPGGGPTSSR